MRARRIGWWLCSGICLFVLGGTVNAFATDEAEAKIAVVDAGIGPCTVEFTIEDAQKNAVYGAKIRVQINYGFLGVKKLDLEAGTNVQGKARFAGLPDKPRQGLTFRASQGERKGAKSYPRSGKCPPEKDTIVLQPASGN